MLDSPHAGSWGIFDSKANQFPQRSGLPLAAPNVESLIKNLFLTFKNVVVTVVTVGTILYLQGFYEYLGGYGVVTCGDKVVTSGYSNHIM